MLVISPSITSVAFAESSVISYNVLILNSDEKLDSYNAPSLEEQGQPSFKYRLTVNENLGFDKTKEKKLIQKNPTEQNPRHIDVTVKENLGLNRSDKPSTDNQIGICLLEN